MTALQTFAAAGEACAATLSFDAAQAILAAHAQPLGVERVALAKAGRRTLAEPVYAQIDSPRYDAAAMDGFAVAEADFAAGLRRFRLAGRAYPGEPWAGRVMRGDAIRIMTGAAMPAGAGRVIVREHCRIEGDHLLIDTPALARPHVRPRASDMARGDEVLPAGRTLDPRAMVVAAAADAGWVTAWRRPRVHVITCGDELAASGFAATSQGAIPDSLSEALLLMARQWGARPTGATLVRDDVTGLSTAAAAALEEADVLVMAGGASKGDRDFAKLALQPLGLELAFADVAIKPGKPAWYGRVGERHVLGLPGNPTAAMTIARLFLAPLLTGIGGRGTGAALHWTRAPLLAPLDEGGPRDAFLCAEGDSDGVRVIERQSASSQCTLAAADVLVRRMSGATALNAGDIVATLRF